MLKFKVCHYLIVIIFSSFYFILLFLFFLNVVEINGSKQRKGNKMKIFAISNCDEQES